MAELLELLELVQAGCAPIRRGKRSHNESQLASDALGDGCRRGRIGSTHGSHLDGGCRGHCGAASATSTSMKSTGRGSYGGGVLVRIYPHRGAAEKVHPAGIITIRHGGEEQHGRQDRDPPTHPPRYLEGDMRNMGERALQLLASPVTDRVELSRPPAEAEGDRAELQNR